MDPIIESGMTFGPFKDGHVFYIEKSATYNAIRSKVKMAEFLVLRTKDDAPDCVWIVEAKQSSPKSDLDEYIGEIRDKLANALSLGVASILKRHANAALELPAVFQNLNLAVAGFRLVLVINGHKKEWLPPLQDALRRALHATVQCWSLGANAILVLNDEDAKRVGLISAP